ncbi:hypothetical protein BOSEA31B_14942 [Hyphomicrobiales bacterium]|nr:hypothetical protein BOSEA31B_14942 [Hyphomicrobiales bacterium]CAH1701429.1 hypothetical protein BOSEA1005_21128 [Hyphomicrobiales bacterium]CAI0345387.1 hypothetical protein BO1005MUT1_390059 [Hyphomicrobiales bacterium]
MIAANFNLVSKHLDAAKQECDKDDRQRREAELAGNGRILTRYNQAASYDAQQSGEAVRGGSRKGL